MQFRTKTFCDFTHIWQDEYCAQGTFHGNKFCAQGTFHGNKFCAQGTFFFKNICKCQKKVVSLQRFYDIAT